jgi:hypothetical protein
MISAMVLALFWITAPPLPVYQMREGDVDQFLGELAKQESSFSGRVIAVAKRSLDTPYFGGPLGEGPEGKYDTDPLMDLSRVDCVTFVEQTVALAASRSYHEAFGRLQKIRYRNGEVAYEKRNHFMITDWIANNRFCEDVSGKLKVETETVTRTVGKKSFFAKTSEDLARGVVDPVMTIHYVPLKHLVEAEKSLPSPALVLLVGKVEWLFVLHCGLYVRDESGKGLLYNASSKAGKVVADDFVGSLSGSTRYLGFTAYSIHEPGT